MLNLNTAERRDLLRLPEMTEELADAILSMREQLGGYQNLHELLLVDGLSPEYFEHTLREHLYIVNSE
jgi:DNA uptake protein ComE-like DNA-binding protein